MSRYFLEVAYKGTKYSGFQVQENANTIQAEVEKAFSIIQREPVILTGSSRTDAGVHALQNYFHFDFNGSINPRFIYKMNALLPQDIVVKRIIEMPSNAHSRFDAISRRYKYRIYKKKDPFLNDRAFYYPYKLDEDILNKAAALIIKQTNFQAFSKTNTQVKNFNCEVLKCEWLVCEKELTFTIEANRFLRGMVRLLTGTMLKMGREKMSFDNLIELFSGNREKAGYSVPPVGLYLINVNYPEDYFLSLKNPENSFP